METEQGKPFPARDPRLISFDNSPSQHVQASGTTGNSTHLTLDFTGSPNRDFDNDDKLKSDALRATALEHLQNEADTSQASASRSFWTIDYYQKFFNVDTDDVLQRIKHSILPGGNENYLITRIRPNPDLYGPFWICLTLVFSIAISGNMANYLQTANSSKYHWKYDFHVVSYAATGIFLYAWLLPVALWAALKWTNGDGNTEGELIQTHLSPGLLELLCLYGYSLAIYIPVAFLWTIQASWFQWSLVAVATCLSGGVLVRSLLPLTTGKHRPIYILFIFGMHLILAAGFMLYFFHIPTNNTDSELPATVITP